MPLTQDEAASALRDIQQAGRRSGEAFGYRIAAPYFVTWGLVWVAGYGGSDLAPDRAGAIWLCVIAIGSIASVLVSRWSAGGKATGGSASSRGWRTLGLAVIIVAFISATITIMQPVSDKAQAAFPALLTAAVYSGVGMWAGMRWVVAGGAIAALTLGGFFFLHAHFALWMAVVGGGGLILAGLWMRSA